ncbi:Beta-galactosidase-1-like protein 2 [Tyrophagus putrescentiae]|nr:Beta-galactosidase-1-like protein 2 [Tyrophagus putrescentiae]
MKLAIGAVFLVLIATFFSNVVFSTADPTLYEFYTGGGIKTGLEANNVNQFTLNGKPYVIFSGTLHYFRVVPQYWAKVLASYRAAGLNAVQIYVPWNRHEDIPGQFDFTSDWLNLGRLLEQVKQADLFAILRPGPFINAEWEFGGLPSWLLRNNSLETRRNSEPYLSRAKAYWSEVMKIINRHQFVKGGSVLMVQIENEYSGYYPDYLEHIHMLFNLTRESGYHQQIFTCDNMSTVSRLGNRTTSIAELFEAINFGQSEYSPKFFNRFHTEIQPTKPMYISEYWSGWFDAWNQTGHSNAEKMMLSFNASVNFYPMLGGTSFDFWAGSENEKLHRRVTTSYDFDTIISEGLQYTEKYHLVRKLYLKLVNVGRMPKLHLPKVPQITTLTSYDNVTVTHYLPLEQLLKKCRKFENLTKPVTMEMLNFGANYGQRYGFILYRVVGKQVKEYQITGPIRDRGIFLVDSVEIDVLQDADNFTTTITQNKWSLNVSSNAHTVDMLVENQGRSNYRKLKLDHARKGIDSSILLNGTPAGHLEVYSLDFNATFMKQLNELNNWVPLIEHQPITSPAMYRGKLQVTGQPKDTYIFLEGWTKGNVFVNGFNIGRYWKVGPQQTLYIPGPLLKTGDNTVEIFELHKNGVQLSFVQNPIWRN